MDTSAPSRPCVGCVTRMLRFLRARRNVDDFDFLFGGVAADFGDIHGVAEGWQRVEFSRRFGAQFVTKLPKTLREMIDKGGDFAVAHFLVNPARVWRVIVF